MKKTKLDIHSTVETGRVGGKKAAARMTPEQRSERARRAAKVRWRVSREPALWYLNADFEGEDLLTAAQALTQWLSPADQPLSVEGMKLILTGKKMAPPMIWRLVLSKISKMMPPREYPAFDTQELIESLNRFGREKK
jgi:hypothetical protein